MLENECHRMLELGALSWLFTFSSNKNWIGFCGIKRKIEIKDDKAE